MRLKDLINPYKWYLYCKFLLRKFTGKVAKDAGFNTPKDLSWKAEVIVYRGLLCEACKNAGKCICIPEGDDEACNCDFVGISTDMEAVCGCGNWKEVKSAEDWEDQKIKNFSNFKLDFVPNVVK